MAGQYDERFVQGEFIKYARKLNPIFDTNYRGIVTIFESENTFENLNYEVQFLLETFVFSTPILMPPDCFRVYRLLPGATTDNVVVRDDLSAEQSILAPVDFAFKNEAAYIEVIFDEYERLLDDYVCNQSEKTKTKLILIVEKMKAACEKLKQKKITTLPQLKSHFETSDLMDYRRASSRWFEPTFTAFEKNLRVNYLKKLIEIHFAGAGSLIASSDLLRLTSGLSGFSAQENMRALKQLTVDVEDGKIATPANFLAQIKRLCGENSGAQLIPTW